MKKVYFILFGLMAVCGNPVFAEPVPGEPVPFENQPTGAERDAVIGGEPLYQLAQSDAEHDDDIATAGYVKSAYNASIKAVNAVADSMDEKQDVLSSENVVVSGAGTNVIDVTAENGTITVTKTYETTVPVGSALSETRTRMWAE